MKRIINSSSSTQLPITKLTEDEISSLPEQVVIVTRRPGASSYIPVFKIVNKEKLKDPDKCMSVSNWGYIEGRDIYLARKDEVREYYDEEIDKLKEEKNKMTRFAL